MSMLRWFLVAVCVSAAVGLSPARGDVRLPRVLGDGMVLQQQTDVAVWGWADPQERVTVRGSWKDAEVSTTADGAGQWRVTCRTPVAGGPYTLTVRGDNEITLSDVLIGEVWICSGQSNMEWPVRLAQDGEAEVAAANYPQIRLFDVEHTVAIRPESDCGGTWRVCGPQTVGGFSAVGYFFGRDLYEKLHVPIGLIGSNWGGTVAEAWTSAGTLRGLRDFDEALNVLARESQEPGYLNQYAQQKLAGWWQSLDGIDPGSAAGGWKSPELADADWPTMNLPSPWERQGLAGVDGVVWFRKEVELPAEWAGQSLNLELGPIDDFDTTWFNGVRVGGLMVTGSWNKPRHYTVPAELVRPGRNVVAVRVVDTGIDGGFSGRPEQLRIWPSGTDESQALSLASAWRYRVSLDSAKLPPWPQITGLHANYPTALYNGMISPLVPFALRGAIWYQGESNRPRAYQYRTLFPAMIGDWRQSWGRGDFPFYYVQIAPFAYQGDRGEAAELREAQMFTLATPNTGMVVTLDIGNPADIHPRNKQEVGRRLALWALARTYGRPVGEFSGPIYREMRVEGDSVRVLFDHTGGELTSQGRALTGFVIAGSDRRFVPAVARIDGETVVVQADAVSEPVAVRYAWGAADCASLFGQTGLPASSFRTDDWTRKLEAVGE